MKLKYWKCLAWAAHDTVTGVGGLCPPVSSVLHHQDVIIVIPGWVPASAIPSKRDCSVTASSKEVIRADVPCCSPGLDQIYKVIPLVVKLFNVIWQFCLVLCVYLKSPVYRPSVAYLGCSSLPHLTDGQHVHSGLHILDSPWVHNCVQ